MNISESKGVVRQILGLETAPHLKASMTTQKIMLIVLLSLIPAFIVAIFYFGFGIFWQFVNCTVTALICECFVCLLRRRNLLHYLSDLSYLVTAMILALTLPPLLPVYYSVIATVFAIIVVKAVFGGLGHNIFNPAMAAFIFLVISCPKIMGTTWVVPAPFAYGQASLSATVDVIYKGEDPENLKHLVEALNLSDNSNDKEELQQGQGILEKLDAITGATFLEKVKTSRKAKTLNELTEADFSTSQNQAYIALAIAYLVGGLILIGCRIILFRMVFTFFTSFAVLAIVLHHFYPSVFYTFTENLLYGGVILCGFYIITDPVTNAGTAKGRIYFSILAAFLIVILRAFGSYSDTVAFAVMLSNACAPLIDVLTHRRSFGIGYKKGDL